MDKEIASALTRKFPNQCITFSKKYVNYDGSSWITVYDKDGEDLYLRAKEYLIEMLILSLCNSFITARCSGSVAVMMMARNFDYVYTFDFGEYESPTEKIKHHRDVLTSADDLTIGQIYKSYCNLKIGGVSTHE